MTSEDWKPLVEHYERFARAREKPLDGLMRESDKSLGPRFKGPLRFELMMQDVLLNAREEAYSAALGWSLGQLPFGRVVDVPGMNLKLPGSRWKTSEDWEYDPEAGVPEGHEGQSGRVDMEIRFKEKLVALIEIKTRGYTDFDTRKHIGYAKSGRERNEDVELIFIAVEDLEIDRHAFSFLSWCDITAGLRKNARHVVDNRNYAVAATHLGFIGAVEQNLLGFGPPEKVTRDVRGQSQEVYPQDLRRTCRVVPPLGEMTEPQEPEFLTRVIVDSIHEEQIDKFGGLHGVRDENALESPIAAAQNVYHYGGGDTYEVAAAYAYHLAESQAYFDGHKRTGVQASLVFVEGCGVDTGRLPDQQIYDLMIKIATYEAGRGDLADYLRSELGLVENADSG